MTTKPVYVLDRRRNLVECDMIVYESDTGVFTLAAGTIVEADVGAGAIGTTEIASGAVANDKILAATIGREKLVPATLTDAEIAANAAIAGSKLGVGVAKTVLTHVKHDDSSPATIVALPAKSRVLHAMAYCTETMDGNGTINLGYAGNTNTFIPNANFQKTAAQVTGDDPAQLGTDLYTQAAQTTTVLPADYTVTTWPRKKTKYFNAATTIIATLTAGSTTQGEFDIVIEYVQVA